MTPASKASPGDAGEHATAPPAQQQGIEQPTFNILPYPAVCLPRPTNQPKPLIASIRNPMILSSQAKIHSMLLLLLLLLRDPSYSTNRC